MLMGRQITKMSQNVTIARVGEFLKDSLRNPKGIQWDSSCEHTSHKMGTKMCDRFIFVTSNREKPKLREFLGLETTLLTSPADK